MLFICLLYLVSWNGTCWKLQGVASHWRTELLHHDDAVFMERPLQQRDDSYSVCLRVGPPGRPLHRLPGSWELQTQIGGNTMSH
uniref:Secreted protein n=1 Tax=Xiphophorus maculatus TaxID=8083 RepID=A0A3B5QNK0_XIPMA